MSREIECALVDVERCRVHAFARACAKARGPSSLSRAERRAGVKGGRKLSITGDEKGRAQLARAHRAGTRDARDTL